MEKVSVEYLNMGISDASWKFIEENLITGKIQQDELLEATLFHRTAKLYPPSIKFSTSFLKILIKIVEALNIEVNESIYELFLEYLNKGPNENCFFRTFTVAKDLQITLKETNNLIAYGTTGLITWPASDILARFLISQNLILHSFTILELGSGLGLLGLSVIKSFHPKRYVFTDHHPSVMKFLKNNIALNLTSVINEKEENYHLHWGKTDVIIRTLDWMNPGYTEKSDIVLAADVLFDCELIPPLVSVIKRTLKTSESKAYIAATVRDEGTINFFLKEIGKSKLVIEKMEDMKCSAVSHSKKESLVKVFIIKMSCS